MNNVIVPIGNIKSAKDIGKIVARYRKMQKLTQVDLAGLAQTGTRFISELENGKGTIQFDKVMHILDLLGVELEAKER
ncbi:MAG: helix-turn-helix transcriptional regulator [Methylococcaceae bacterium]